MEITSAAQQKLDFMTLLVTELQNQNPLEPMDNQQMAAQLAQFTQLELSEEMNGNLSTINETIEKMNAGFEGAMLMAKVDYARSLLGHEISFYNQTYQQTFEGSVERIRFVDGEPVLDVRTEVPQSETSASEQTMQVKLDEIQGINL